MKIKGSKKPDDLVGTDEDDKIMGLGGDDNITAKGGHDTVDAGKGDDKIVIAANTSANVDAGKGNDSVKVNAGALGSTIDLGKGSDTVEIKSSTATGQTFTIIGADSDDAVNFALGQDAYTVTENGAEGYTVVDANGNSYSLSGVSDLTFDGIPYTPSNPVNDAPVVSTPIADQTATANTAYSFQFSATAFTDPDSDALTYTASLANGGALPSWLAFNAATRTFSGTPTASNVGAVSVRVTASDGSLSATDDFTITVGTTPPPPPPPIVDPVVNGRVLMLTSAYDYDVSESGNTITVSYAGRTKTYNSADIDGVDTRGSNSVDVDTTGWDPRRDFDGDVNFTNVNFLPAPNGPLGTFWSSFPIGGFDVNGDITVNGNREDYFRAAWDYLDNLYTSTANSYYSDAINSIGIDLGIEYALYLEGGGDPLFGPSNIGKYTADPAVGGNGIVDRLQYLHDNLLGNLDEGAIAVRFDPNVSSAQDPHADLYPVAEIRQRIIDAGLSDYLGVNGRGVYSGNEGDTVNHDKVRVFDYEQGFDRPDYAFFDDNGTVDTQATTGGHMYFGLGNNPNNYVISQHEGAGIETALKVHVRGGADYLPTSAAGASVVTFDVASGTQAPANWGTPAKWNFDYSIVTGLNGSKLDMDDFDFEIWIDTDAGAGTNYKVFELQHAGLGNTPFASGGAIAFKDEDGSNANIAQNSVNFGFDSVLGNNAFAAGGIYDIQLRGYDALTNDLLSSVHIQVELI